MPRDSCSRWGSAAYAPLPGLADVVPPHSDLIAAAAKARDRQLDLTDTRVPARRAVLLVCAERCSGARPGIEGGW